jgi:Spy/CpxP family protein refolding chaperone
MKKVLTAAILTFAASFAAIAQQTPAQGAARGAAEQPAEARRMRGMRMLMRMRRHQGMQAMRRLNLSEQQIEKVRSIRQSAFQSTQTQRDELRQLFMTRKSGGQLTPEQEARAKQLREGLRDAHKRTRDEMLGVLTTEQRAQLEQLKQERKARREQFRQRREGFRQRRQQMRGDAGQPPSSQK